MSFLVEETFPLTGSDENQFDMILKPDTNAPRVYRRARKN